MPLEIQKELQKKKIALREIRIGTCLALSLSAACRADKTVERNFAATQSPETKERRRK
jgi:hypothetical protein